MTLADEFPLLSKIESPADLRGLRRSDLAAVADELRRYLLMHIGIPAKPIHQGKSEDCLAAAGLDLAALRVQIDAWWRPMRPQMADAAR